MDTLVKCPHCKTECVYGPENAFRPFCSKRCRLIDLGDWFNEEHRIPSDEAAPNDDPGNA